MSAKLNKSLLLLIFELFRTHEASDGERGGAEANTSPSGEQFGLGWVAGLKAEVSSSGVACSQHSWRELLLSNMPLSTRLPTAASFSGEIGGEIASLLLPRLAFSVSIKRSNGSQHGGATGKEPSDLLLVVEGIVNGAAVAFSSLFRTSGLMGAAPGEKRS